MIKIIYRELIKDYGIEIADKEIKEYFKEEYGFNEHQQKVALDELKILNELYND